MAPAKAPLFLARRSYRLRRVMDGLRLLPLLGLILFVLPGVFVLAPSDIAWLGLYIFGVWTVLILLTAYLSRKLSVALEAALEGMPATGEGRDD